MRFLFLILILAGMIFNISNQPKIVYSAVCAPGDVLVNGECLYGSDVIPDSFGNPITDPRANIRIAINIALGFLGVIVVVMIIYGGFLWLTAAGNDDRVKKGRHVLIWAAIGAIVISIAWTIASYILSVGSMIG